MRRRFFVLIGLALSFSACAPSFSRQSLDQVEAHLSFQALLQDPDAYEGKTVMYGGEIIQTRAEANDAWVEVLQKPLDRQHKPQPGDVSHGRFLVHFSSFQDPAIYAPGRKITVIGEVRGKIVQKINELDYSYPLIESRESRLWRPEDPGGPFFPFWDWSRRSFPMKKIMALLAAMILVLSCAPFSKRVMDQADPALTFEDVQRDPSAFQGKMVVWGGVIIETINRPDETVIKVRQADLDFEKRPAHPDRSRGRFLIRYKGFLDPAIYGAGREVTAAGEIIGEETLPLGNRNYIYPVVLATEIHLWEKIPAYRPLYPYPWYYDPFYPWGWYRPYGRHPYWW